ncbi:MAG: aa3-type cytochrome oxidase subunit IV [Candidatus Dormibacteria bacterium]
MSSEQIPTEPPKGPTGEAEHEVPGPSFWPFVLAIGVAMALIGVITKLEVVIIGLIIIVVSIGGWIRAARREYRALP